MKFVFLLTVFIFSIPIFSKEINYKLIVDNPHRNYFTIEITYQTDIDEFVDFVMPAWTPGSYVIKNWSKNVIDVHAVNEKNAEIDFEKIDKQTWRVVTKSSNTIKFSYRVYAYSINNPYHAHIEKHFAYFNGAVIFMYVDGYKENPHNIEFVYPEDWELHTSLQIRLDQNKYQAVNYDEFIDCPAFLGNITSFSFNVQNKEHYIVYNGHYEANQDQIIDDLSKMIEWFYQMFGELPYKHYTFFLRVSDPGGGGIEHLYSNVSSITPQSLKADIEDYSYYSNFLMLQAHEFFHLYNVKRIRPSGLGPFNYKDEIYTNMLWVSEGFTSYYTHRPLSKAGIISPNKILQSWSTYINRLGKNTALNIKPVSDYSYDAWLRSDIPDYSYRTYYTKGALIALLLDIDMRMQTNHKKNIDGFFRYLYDEIYKKDITFNFDSFYEYLYDYSKINFSEFFKKYITGTFELPLRNHLNKIGLELNVDFVIPYIGIKLNSNISDAAIVFYVYPNSPADKLKIGRGDQIVSIDRKKVSLTNWQNVLEQINQGEEFELKWIHDDRVLTSNVRVDSMQVLKYSITKKENINNYEEKFLQKLLYP